MKKLPSMNQEISKWPVYALSKSGVLFWCPAITSTEDYDHGVCQIHHYIPKSQYYRNQKWFEERNIRQKLILVSIPLHEQIHGQAIKNLTDEQFMEKYGISRWDLIFNRKHSKYEGVS